MSKLAHSNDETMAQIERDRLRGEGIGTYWLIERGSPAEWWVGNHSTNPQNHWTRDSSKALKFNEWGANNHAEELKSWGVEGDLIATEHMDMTGPDCTFTPSDASGSNGAD